MQKKLKAKISLFSGGTGNNRFINLIKEIPGVDINIIVNGYDDGKSTGELRKFIPGMLGPSDFRKNYDVPNPMSFYSSSSDNMKTNDQKQAHKNKIKSKGKTLKSPHSGKWNLSLIKIN